jgi:hypothetical protein
MSDGNHETHQDFEEKNEKLLAKLIESLVGRFKDGKITEKERQEALETLRATLSL